MRPKALADGTAEPQKALTDGTAESKKGLTGDNETETHSDEKEKEASPLKPKKLFNVGLTEDGDDKRLCLTKQQNIVEQAMEARANSKGTGATKPKKEQKAKDVKKEEKKEKQTKSEKTEPREKEGLKMDRKNCHSRAYHRNLKKFEKGHPKEKAKKLAAVAAAKELEELGFPPSGMAGQKIQKKPASKKK